MKAGLLSLQVVEMKGFLFQADAMVWVAASLLSTVLILSLISESGMHFQQGIQWMKKGNDAHALSDLIAKRLAGPDGSLNSDALEGICPGNSHIRAGGMEFGSFPPENAPVFFFRRIVFIEGRPEVLEVRLW